MLLWLHDQEHVIFVTARTQFEKAQLHRCFFFKLLSNDNPRRGRVYDTLLNHSKPPPVRFGSLGMNYYLTSTAHSLSNAQGIHFKDVLRDSIRLPGSLGPV